MSTLYVSHEIKERRYFMDKVRLGIIGLGNMGNGHLKNLKQGLIKNVEVAALCDIDEKKMDAVKNDWKDAAYFKDYKDLLKSGKVDAVLIATPHYLHPVIAIEAFNEGLNVLSEKPIGVYTKKVLEMYDVAKKSGKVFGIMYNQRTTPMYQKMCEIVQGGELGELKRVVWIITDWYRTQAYYNSGGWRATWEGEGGGVLLNQCPHNLDLWQWITGMPVKVRAFCTEGKYHNIEVEDDVTAYVEYANGATGVFITTTGECPGTNRLEISGDRGKLVAENGKLTFTKLAVPERKWCFEAENGFASPDKEVIELDVSKKDGVLYDHSGILQNFVNAILTGEKLLAPGLEGINGLNLSNAMFLSSWLDKTVEIPVDPDLYWNMLQEKIKNSTFKKEVKEMTVDISSTYGGASK